MSRPSYPALAAARAAAWPHLRAVLTAPIFLTIALCLAIAAGCASFSTITANAEETVYTAKTAYAAALTLAVEYKRLPRCSATQALPCSDAAVITQLQKADDVAFKALDAAEAAVRAPSINAQARASAVEAGNAALKAFKDVLPAKGATR